jgi:GTP cyclohydrolase IIa
MIRVGLVHLKDYESWIKSIGYDREWVVQATQATIYRSLVVESAKMGMFSIPLTYDSYIVVINAARIENFIETMKSLRNEVPVAFNTYIGSGHSYAEAIENLKEASKFVENVEKVNDLEETAVVHLDLDGYNRFMHNMRFLDAEGLINMLFQKVRQASTKNGGLTYYAGGDNFICFVPCERIEVFLNIVVTDNIKAGVGIASKPRDALKLAAQALDIIRNKERSNRIFILREST